MMAVLDFINLGKINMIPEKKKENDDNDNINNKPVNPKKRYYEETNQMIVNYKY